MGVKCGRSIALALALAVALALAACAPAATSAPGASPSSSGSSLPEPPLPKESIGWATQTTSTAIPEKFAPEWEWAGRITYADAVAKASDVSFPATSVVGAPVKVFLDHKTTPRPIDYGVIVQYASGIRFSAFKAQAAPFDVIVRAAEVSASAVAAGVRNPIEIRLLRGHFVYADPGRPWELATPTGREYSLGGARLVWTREGRTYTLWGTTSAITLDELMKAAETIK
jgi:hypothetical protein